MQANYTQTKKVTLLENPKYYLSMTALFRNEDRFLKEWIEFYKLMGVEHFYLFNHLSTDNYKKVLDLYIEEGTVEVTDLSYEPKNQDEWYDLIHFPTYINITKKVKDVTEWLIIVDTDEFLYPVKEQNLISVLKNYDDYASLTVNWRKFGSNNVQKIGTNELMLEELHMRDSTPDLLVKNIIKPRYVETFINPHFAVLKQGYSQITENYQFINGAYIPAPTHNVLTINHYQYRDLKFFNSTKVSRVHLYDNSLEPEVRQQKIKNLYADNERYSSIYDDGILRFAPALRERMFGDNPEEKFIPPIDIIDLAGNRSMLSLPHNLTFVIDKKEYNEQSYSLLNGYGMDPYLLRKIMSFTKLGETYVEIGSSYGEFALQMSQKLGSYGKVYGFEPDNNLYQFLYANVFLNAIENIELENSMPVKLDSYFVDNNVDIIRINAPGNECKILDGAKDIISTSGDLRLFIKWQSSSGECLSKLVEQGYSFIDLVKFNEECSYLSYQMNYELSVGDILSGFSVEFLAVRNETFHGYRKLYSANAECISLANQMMFNAATEGRDEDIKYALANGADVNYYNEAYHGPALYYAIATGHIDTARLLLKHGADVELGYKKMVTPLYLAAEHGSYGMVELLLSYNANKNFSFFDRTPSQIAELNGHTKIVELLSRNDSFIEESEKSSAKVAFITAIYGNYESSCKPYATQTIPTDFICFTDNNDIISNNWNVDLHPYHYTNPSAIDNGSYLNSFSNNNHTFNIAKYYKQSFHNIPRLQEYDVVVWLDGTIEITNSTTAEWVLGAIQSHPIITWEHSFRNGSLEAEADTSMWLDKYTSKFWLGQKQPYQDISAQYQDYVQDGYDEKLWSTIDSQRKNLGVWITCFVAFNNKNEAIHKFLDFWYLQTLKYTTQDQIGFSYVVQKSHLYPYTLPDASIKGNSDKNYLFVKHYHNGLKVQDVGSGVDPSKFALLNLVNINDYEQVKALLETRAEVRLNVIEALRSAVAKNYYQIAKILLEYGVDIEEKSINNYSLLYQSVDDNNLEMTELLLDHGANIEFTLPSGSTPLFVSAYFGRDEMVNLLLSHDANKDVQVNGISAFQIALINDHPSTAIILAGGNEQFCAQIIETEFETKYVDMCGEIKINL